MGEDTMRRDDVDRGYWGVRRVVGRKHGEGKRQETGKCLWFG